VEEGIIEEISLKFTPMGVEVKGKAGPTLVAVEGSGLTADVYYPVVKLASVAEKANLAPPPKSKKKGAGAAPAEASRPTKSLCKADFEGTNPQQLQQRMNAVAQAAGGGPLVGRVRSAGRFNGDSTVSYQDWWEHASCHDRALSLCQGRHLTTLTNEEIGRLAGLRCPFRGTAEFTVADDDEEEEPTAAAQKAATSAIQPADGSSKK